MRYFGKRSVTPFIEEDAESGFEEFHRDSKFVKGLNASFIVLLIPECSKAMKCRHVVFTTSFQGNRLPDWITHRSNDLLGIHLTLPSSEKVCRIRGLNMCFVTTTVSSTKSTIIPRTVIRNLTKRHSIKIYGPQRWVAREEGDIVWLSHWMLANNEFEVGDEVRVDFAHIHDHVDVKEYGVSVVYDDDDDDDHGNNSEDPLADYKSWKLGNIGYDTAAFY